MQCNNNKVNETRHVVISQETNTSNTARAQENCFTLQQNDNNNDDDDDDQLTG